MEPEDKIVFSLDYPNYILAEDAVEKLAPKGRAPYVGMFLISLPLIMEGCAHHLKQFIKKWGGRRVFWNSNLNDTPRTIARAVNEILSYPFVDFFTVNAEAGPEAIRAALDNKGSAEVVGNTILTSLYRETAECDEKNLALVQMLREEGVRHIVCSPFAAPKLEGFIKFAPGIRPSWAKSPGSCKLTMTPAEALRAGADYLIIKNPIASPPPEIGDSVKAVKKILVEIERAFEGVTL